MDRLVLYQVELILQGIYKNVSRAVETQEVDHGLPKATNPKEE